MWHALQKIDGYPIRTAAQFRSKFHAEMYVFWMTIWMTITLQPSCRWDVRHDDNLP